ncbi:hypothetical protein RFI_01262 [Reticulomyxa filosa]|uniref:Uncharacterized protein n=1 Tax=Reticulomyxa filosa TaxID=46433 RepID=X6PDR0_RETFI|nr:hypothetical protein RFI_36670 [Reticulomyxa filosa]ETO35802.1 hypothetical protein RFI_01262 [Reticulomyxa filosa]|eukprot:ETO00770.1 hypothetical protein RFI_36670 [Reticulomyxa filosa]
MEKANELFRNAMEIGNMQGYSYKTDVNSFMKKLVKETEKFGSEKKIVIGEERNGFTASYNLQTVKNAIHAIGSGSINRAKDLKDFFDRKADKFGKNGIPKKERKLELIKKKEKKTNEKHIWSKNSCNSNRIATDGGKFDESVVTEEIKVEKERKYLNPETAEIHRP